MTNELVERQQEDKFEPLARILAANAVAQSLSFTMERKYLESIDSSRDTFNLVSQHRTDSPAIPYWIEINQIGKPLDDSVENCFTAIQKILTSCFLPNKSQLVFLVHSENGVCHIYLGIRPFDSQVIDASFAESLSDFMKGIWPGLKCKRVRGKNKLNFLEQKLNDDENGYNHICALTGIPSMETQYKSVYPATIDKLIAGMRKKDFTYLVVADPIQEKDVDEILYKCRDFNGQAESLKSFNFSESSSKGTNNSYSKAKSISDSVNESTSTTKTDKKWILGGVGLLLASTIFPPAAAVASTAVAINEGMKKLAGVNMLAEFAPKKTKTKGTSHAEGITDTISTGFSQNQSKSISRNLVNKHIEAVSEHLFYHSKRFETGKAIGCWEVGVYLMAEDRTDLHGASLQLKSILSGQESIFEPVRIHDISTLVDKDKNQSLALMAAPKIMVNTANGYFDHPLGDHYKELKTVLTTKELSYLINFPLRSVPGISVVDSSPEFSLNQSEVPAEADSVDFGRLLYGGTETEMSYRLPIDLLAKHTLLSGINGTGKTNTVQSILNSLHGKIPFLIIEPAKSEYVDWAVEYNKLHPETPIDIYIPGCKSYKDKQTRKPIVNQKILKINPFEVVWLNKEQEPNVLTHIDRLKSTFAAAFPMYDILPILMEDLIYTIYQNKTTDWLTQEPEYGKTLPPTLNSMSIGVDKVISNRGYEERIERNMKACLNTRIDSLKRGWKGEMLNTVHSTPWKELFEKPCVINLSYVGDDVDKAFFMAIILQFLYEYRTACAEIGEVDFNDNSCKHLTVIEEAHRVMMKCEKADDPQYKSAMMFSNMLSEIRAYGEGMMLVDQVPTRLIPDAIKNSNTKITHRLVAEDDCTAVAESMGISKEQKMIIPKLLVGQCLVSTSLTTDKHWVKVNKVK